jgi:hypothetical protein
MKGMMTARFMSGIALFLGWAEGVIADVGKSCLRKFVEGGGGRNTYYKVENSCGVRGIIHFPDLEGGKGEGKGLA